jgi:hypothetical protein
MQSFLRRLRRGGRRGDRASRNRLRSGLSRLRHLQHSVVEDPTWAAEFIVEIKEQPKLYRVKTEQMKKWLRRNGSSPRDLMQRRRLREMLAGSG